MCVAIVSNLACCIGSAACSCCCKFLPSIRSSTSTRLAYGVVLLVASLLSWLMQSQWAEDQLQKIPVLIQDLIDENCGDACDYTNFVGILAAYRVMFTVSMFFFIMSLFMIGVRTGKDCRAGVQSGFWAVKLAIIIALAVGAWFLPNNFYFVYQYIAMAGAGLFIIIQLVLIIDFAYTWSESWVERYEETDRNEWLVILVVCAFLMYAGAVAMWVCMYLFYTGPDAGCALNKFFISFNLILCIIITVVSCLPRVQEANPRSGLLQSSMVALYMTYLTWSAISHEPSDDFHDMCTPTMSLSFGGASTSSVVLGAGFSLVAVVYSAIRRGSQHTNGLMVEGGGGDDDDAALLDPSGGDKTAGSDKFKDEEANEHRQEVIRDEDEGTVYSYSFFHFVFSCAAVYILMLVSNWSRIDDPSLDEHGSLQLERGWAAVWIKAASSWVCCLIYIWTLMAPVMFPDRFEY